MDLNHHPSTSTLTDYTFGTTSKISELVIKAHLGACSQCRESIKSFETVGGELLMSTDSTTASPKSVLEKEALRICEEHESSCPTEDIEKDMKLSRTDGLESGSELIDLFSTYLDCSFEALPWKSAGRDVKLCRLRTDGNTSLWMIRGNPGSKLPSHSHSGQELTLVLKGSYACSSKLYSKGDLQECDEESTHQPIIVGKEECVSLVATEGKLRFQHWAPKLLQPLIGI